jgi:glucose-6-phosphate-specific signal transduction histidine kinase
VIEFIFYAHKKLYGYPCRSHVRLAISQDLATESFRWRVGMLYVCGESLNSIAKHMEVSREEIRQTLVVLTLGVRL